MKKLFKTLLLLMVLALPVAVIAQTEAENQVAEATEALNIFEGEVIDVQGGAPVVWTLTATEKEAGLFELTFTGNIADGYHGYPLTDMFSAPFFEFTKGEVVGDMRETEPTHESVDEFGDTVHHYLHKMVFIQDVKAAAGSTVMGTINTNICTNETNQ
jgi:hypothetical protein